MRIGAPAALVLLCASTPALAALRAVPPSLGVPATLSAAVSPSAAALSHTLSPALQAKLEPVLLGKVFDSVYFDAFARGDAAALEGVLAHQRGITVAGQVVDQTVWPLYGAIGQIAASPLSAADKTEAAFVLGERFAAHLESLPSEGVRLSRGERAALARMAGVLRDGRLLAGFFAAERLQSSRAASQELIARLEPFAEPPQEAERRWELLPPPQAPVRTKGRYSFEMSIPDTRRKLDETRFALERQEARRRLLTDPRFSAGFRLRMDALSVKAVAALREELSGWPYNDLSRPGLLSMWSGLLRGARFRQFGVPDNPNLRMRPEPGGFVVRARFTTNIDDKTVLAAVKEAIERKWRGRFRDGGRSHSLRVEVEIKRLPPGKPFPKNALVLVPAKGATSHAGLNGIHLSRKFKADEVAHEFSHVIGLNDEYEEGFDFDRLVSDQSGPRNGFLVNGAGPVKARHLSLAYRLLKQNSLEPAP